MKLELCLRWRTVLAHFDAVGLRYRPLGWSPELFFAGAGPPAESPRGLRRQAHGLSCRRA